MRQLLKADWLRFRRRRDFWVIGIGVALILGIGFISSYRSDVTDPPPFNEAEFRQQFGPDSGFFEGMPLDEANAQIEQMVADARASDEQYRQEWERQQAISLQKYDILQSPFTLVGAAVAPLIGLIIAASFAVGDEFRYGTLRTTLLAAGNRRRFLGARLISLLAMTAGLYAALALLAIVLAYVLRLVGAEVVSSTTPVNLAAGLGWFGARILVTVVVLALGTALTLILRSGALPLVIIVIGGFLELFLSALPIFGEKQFLAGVPQAFLSSSAETLTSRLGYDTHAIALAQVESPRAVIELPLLVVAGIVVAWGVLFVLAADWRIRRMDVVE
jgi:ABC-type transport system involved in multi-copper enzyme maturation permease subunit